ncbi:MAG: hypothetical protein KIC73_18425, partial [Clostridiales bacterium]|nr:hypothetical protein [Clostridiales bacterium]
GYLILWWNSLRLIVTLMHFNKNCCKWGISLHCSSFYTERNVLCRYDNWCGHGQAKEKILFK